MKSEKYPKVSREAAKLSPSEKSLLRAKIIKKSKTPRFRRQEVLAQKTLKKKWRRPRGKQSKMRKQEKGRGRIPKPGYGSPAAVRDLNRQGFRTVRVANPNDLQKINREKETAMISSTVGRKKRLDILKKAQELGISVANA